MHMCTHVCWARKCHVLGGACREALGWIPILIWLWFHTSFPSRPGEAKLHRWPSGWHFRTRPGAHWQPPPFSASVALLILQGSDWARTEKHWGVVGRGLRHKSGPG